MIVDQINWNVGKIILGRFKGTEEIAVYSVGYSLYSYYMSIGLPIAGMFTPRIHSLVERTTGQPELRKQYLTDSFIKVGRIQWIILGLILTGMIFFGKPFIGYWAGTGYELSYYVALLLIVSGTIDLIQNLGIEIQRAQNKHRFRSYIYVAMAVINVIISIILCQRYGAIGSAIGTAISLVLVQGVVINIYLHKKCCIDVVAFWKDILRLSLGLVIPCTFGIVIMLFVNMNSIFILLVAILAYVAIYFLSMLFLGMNSYERSFVKKAARKFFNFLKTKKEE